MDDLRVTLKAYTFPDVKFKKLMKSNLALFMLYQIIGMLLESRICGDHQILRLKRSSVAERLMEILKGGYKLSAIIWLIIKTLILHLETIILI